MIALDEFKAYKYYLALRLHFTTDNYDVFKHQGRVKATREAFNKRNDLFFIKKIARKFDEKTIVNFLVANFVSGNKWGGVFDSNAETIYDEWIKKIESLTYTFKTDFEFLFSECERRNKDFLYIFEGTSETHPIVLKAFLGKKINIETMVILNDVYFFVDRCDKMLYNDIVWNDVSRLIKKYKPFLHYDRKKINGYIEGRLGS